MSQKQSFDKLGLLQKAKLLERAKELGDKKTLLKEALKQKQYEQSQQHGSGSNNSGLSQIQSTFSKKLDNGQYLCTCCSVKLPDNIQAQKHFNSTDHKQKVDEFKKKVQEKIDAKKDQIVKEQEMQRQLDQEHQKAMKTQYMLVQEEEIIDDDEDDQDDKYDDVEQDNERELDLLAQLDREQQQQSSNNVLENDNQTQRNVDGNNVLEQVSNYQEEETKNEYNQDEEDEQAGYQDRLYNEINELEQLQARIDEKKKQQINKKRQNKLDITKLLEEDNGDIDFSLNLKRRKY